MGFPNQLERKTEMAKNLGPTAKGDKATLAMAYVEIAVPVNQISVSPDGKFINLPWGASGTFTHGSNPFQPPTEHWLLGSKPRGRDFA